MTANLFDPDAIMREVRAVVDRSPPATTATLLQKEAECSKVAIVASRSGRQFHEASVTERSKVATVATTPLPTEDIEKVVAPPTIQPTYPLFYTEAERETARRDAERLGYGRGPHRAAMNRT
jgi:hypothetical protein